jgi:hypothetical protein
VKLRVYPASFLLASILVGCSSSPPAPSSSTAADILEHRTTVGALPPIDDPRFVGLVGTRVYSDINGDGVVDFCRVTSDGQFLCTLGSKGGANPFSGATFNATIRDKFLIYGSTFASVRGKGKIDACFLVVRDVAQPGVKGSVVTPTCYPLDGSGVSTDYQRAIIVGSNHSETDILRHSVDPGIPTTRTWIDVDGQGRSAFCRIEAAKDANPGGKVV